MMSAYDLFVDLLGRRPAVAMQLANEVAALAERYQEQYPNRLQTDRRQG